MFRMIWIFLLCCLNEVYSPLPETSSLSHLEPTAELNETGRQGLKFEAEPPFLTSSWPATTPKAESKQKLKDIQILESFPREDGSAIENRRKAPVRSRPLEEGGVERSRDFRIGTKNSKHLHQILGPSSAQSSESQTWSRGPSYEDTPIVFWERTYKPVWIPQVVYTEGHMLHYTPKAVRSYYPMRMIQGPGAASEIDSEKVTHLGHSRQVSGFERQIKQTKPTAALSQKRLWKSKNLEKITSPQLKSTSKPAQIDEAGKLPELSNPLRPYEKAFKIPFGVAKFPKYFHQSSHFELDKSTDHSIESQGARKDHFNLLSSEKGAADKNILSNHLNNSKSKTKIINDELDLNIHHEESDTQYSASKSTTETELNNILKPEVEQKMSRKKKLLEKQALAKDQIKGSLGQSNFLKTDEKFISKAQKTVGYVYSVDEGNVREAKRPQSLRSQIAPRKPLVIQSNENSLSTEDFSWIKVERKQKGKYFQQHLKTSTTKEPTESSVDELSHAPPFKLHSTKSLSQSELDKMGIDGRSEIEEMKNLRSEEDPTSSSAEQHNHVNEDEEKVFPLSFENVEKQDNKENCDIESNIKAQESSEMRSAEDKHTPEPISADSSAAESALLGLEHLPRDILSEKEEIRSDIGKRFQHTDANYIQREGQIAPSSHRSKSKDTKEKGKKSSKKKGSKKNLERHNKHTSGRKKSEFSDLNVEIPSSLVALSPKLNHDSHVTGKHNIEAPLPELAFVAYFEPNAVDLGSDLWESQLYASLVNPKALSGRLRKKAELVLESKWVEIENVFAEAISPWKKGPVNDAIYPGLQKSNLPSQMYKTKPLEDELSQRLQTYLKVSDESQNLTLGDIDARLFKILQAGWDWDQKALIAKLKATQNDFDDINESHRRLYTLSRQILHNTIVENWKDIKGFLVKTEQFSQRHIDDIEAMFQLSTLFPDITKPLRNLNESKQLVQTFKENKAKIMPMLQKVMGIQEAEIRSQMFEFLPQYSGLPAWWEKTDYMAKYKGNGLMISEVLAIGEACFFGVLQSQDPKEKAAEILSNMYETHIYKRKVLPWYHSPERAFLVQNFAEEYETRMKWLMSAARLFNAKNLNIATKLIHRTDPKQKKVVTLKYEDMWYFHHNGLAPEYMTEMYLAGVGRANQSQKKWRAFVDRAPNLLTKEQSSLAINWFMHGDPKVSEVQEFDAAPDVD
ncbi:hypothetical protein O181_007809 [Austropuccinia psidii MF-1]|uniref:Uncharacterized protein n=1 Tax=Austropuccinia psidii MF-1 TaxID=1389203 RepID=A0A9Q3BMQ8_9BASI|nr:hypothetical protein [Austropuccinia psidii MF-1]